MNAFKLPSMFGGARRSSRYAERIREVLKAMRQEQVPAAYVEAWMRLEHPTLDNLSPAQFEAEARVAIGCVLASSAAENLALAKSYGLAVVP